VPHALREYAVVADGERGALIGPDGDLVWMCFPYWDSPAVFSGLVGGRGRYDARPVDEWRVWGGYYEPRSMIWRSRWVNSDGIVECREALARPARRDRLVVLRRFQAIDRPARVTAHLDIRSAFDRRAMSDLRLDDGIWAGRSGDIHLRWVGAADAVAGDGLELILDLEAGQAHDLVLELSLEPGREPLDPRDLWAATESDWHRRVPSCSDTLAPVDAELAYAVLTGLTSECGGMAAAITTALPERMEGDRNYDYRYSWIRDQCYAGEAVATHGGRLDLLDTAVRFVAERVLADEDELHAAYTVAGDPAPTRERSIDLPGYPGSPVVVGNDATGRFQLDAVGEALHLFAHAARLDRLPSDAAKAARVAASVIGRRWQQPDAGIWETQQELWTHSRLACVAGLRYAADAIATPAEVSDWRGLAEHILSETTRTSLNSAGHWQRAPDDPRVDAALLIPAVRGALAADDPRTVATLAAVREELVDEGFVYRYHVGDQPLGDAEGAFMLCGFLLALAEHQQGDLATARGRFERIRSGCSTTGLFTEEYDVRQRQLRANLPQAFVHALMLETATRLAHDA